MSDRYNQLEKLAVLIAIKTQTLAAMTQSTTYTGFLTPAPILDSSYDGVGGFGNSSITSTNSVLLQEVAHVADITNDGDYFVNYKTGYYKIKAGASATPVLTWRVKVLEYNATGVTVTVGATTVADGANVVLGSLADAAVTTSTSGTISGKLRGIISLLVSYISTKLICNDTAANCPTSVDSTAYTASGVIKASAGIFYGMMGYNSKSTAQFIQIFNSATVPVDTTVPVIILYVPGNTSFSIDFNPFGKSFATGISWSNSSTGATKTIGSADVWINAQCK